MWVVLKGDINFTQSKYGRMIIKMAKFQRNRMCGKFHIRKQFFVHSKSLIVLFTRMDALYAQCSENKQLTY